MKSTLCKKPALRLVALTAAATLLCLAPGALGASPLPRSDYTVRAACAAPAPGRAACLALQLVPVSSEAEAHTQPLAVGTPAAGSSPAAEGPASKGTFGFTPSDLHTAYQLPSTASGEPPTIALVDAYNDLSAESDLKVYDEEMGLPACVKGGCFKQVNQNGAEAPLPFPKTQQELNNFKNGTAAQRSEAEEAIGWDAEISLDIETAHAICENCKILLVEARSPASEDLQRAEAAAETLGAKVISNSWGGPELDMSASAEESSPFNHPETVITASAGDDGYLEWGATQPSGQASFPASSAHVIAVGGTRLSLNESSHAWQSESVWNDDGATAGVKEGFGAGGGGCSQVFSAQPWQSSVSDWAQVGCGANRAVADVSADADPYTGVAVYDTSEECESEHLGQIVHWCTYGGTSLASPIIAATYALAGGAQGVKYPARTLYEKAVSRPASLHDVFSGSNGECLKPFVQPTGTSGCSIREQGKNCSSRAICLARAGFDGPSGLGTPHGIAAFQLSPATETAKEKAEYNEALEHQQAAELKEAAKSNEEAEAEAAANRKAEAEREEAAKRRQEVETASAAATSPATSSSPPSAPVASVPASPVQSTPATAGAPTPALSALALTLKAVVALNASRPRVTQVSFAFNLNAADPVHVTLARRVRIHGHTRWQTVQGSLTIAATRGHNSRHLAGHALLLPGLYRLTATPMHGLARSILFHIG